MKSFNMFKPFNIYVITSLDHKEFQVVEHLVTGVAQVKNKLSDGSTVSSFLLYLDGTTTKTIRDAELGDKVFFSKKKAENVMLHRMFIAHRRSERYKKLDKIWHENKNDVDLYKDLIGKEVYVKRSVTIDGVTKAGLVKGKIESIVPTYKKGEFGFVTMSNTYLFKRRGKNWFMLDEAIKKMIEAKAKTERYISELEGKYLTTKRKLEKEIEELDKKIAEELAKTNGFEKLTEFENN